MISKKLNSASKSKFGQVYRTNSFKLDSSKTIISKQNPESKSLLGSALKQQSSFKIKKLTETEINNDLELAENNISQPNSDFESVRINKSNSKKSFKLKKRKFHKRKLSPTYERKENTEKKSLKVSDSEKKIGTYLKSAMCKYTYKKGYDVDDLLNKIKERTKRLELQLNMASKEERKKKSKKPKNKAKPIATEESAIKIPEFISKENDRTTAKQIINLNASSSEGLSDSSDSFKAAITLGASKDCCSNEKKFLLWKKKK